ncbi:hypothetical protein R69927_02248 [Paraburkholderia domus]|uniref:Uncharacterized protein n=1 Tax=Paraburkholderia domus TaxID=2793075 RepID=A0A9N8MWR7_9BURK|nr:hypothetical protein R69927_02248 [Paraburkholderia domus]CAE6863600.1 hypothetical protein R70006_08214 [Paraburkholderia domus]CAE6916389.1 hypothetical protein R70211_04234 [Paraburkholderia domus]
MRNQVAGNLRRIAEHEADRPSRHAGFDERLQQRRRRRRGFLRRLDEERAAARERRAQLAHDLIDREIPRREGGHRADRFLEHGLLNRQIARRHDPAVDAAAFVGEPLDDVRRGQHFDACLGERLALFLHHQAGDVRSALAHQGCGLAHGRRAFVGRNLAPGFEAALRGRQRPVQIGNASMGHLADGFTGGRIDDVEGFAARSVAPFAVNQEARICIA